MKGYIRHATLSIDTITNLHNQYIKLNGHNKGKIKFNDFEFNLASDRLLTFHYNGTTCQQCGVKGQFYSLDSIKVASHNKTHLNLIGISKDGKEVLMTSCNIIPKIDGGSDHLSNKQTLCENCNNLNSK